MLIYEFLCVKMPVPGLHNGIPSQLAQGRNFDDLEPSFATSRLMNGHRNLPENNLLKSFSLDKEKGSSVAKIKVVVCSTSLSFFLLFGTLGFNRIYIEENSVLENNQNSYQSEPYFDCVKTIRFGSNFLTLSGDTATVFG